MRALYLLCVCAPALCMHVPITHSDYGVAVPVRKKGLFAKEVTVMMIRHWLTVFRVPRTICSDPRPQFTGGWFKAMCSLMGIRHAKRVRKSHYHIFLGYLIQPTAPLFA